MTALLPIAQAERARRRDQGRDLHAQGQLTRAARADNEALWAEIETLAQAIDAGSGSGVPVARSPDLAAEAIRVLVIALRKRAAMPDPRPADHARIGELQRLARALATRADLWSGSQTAYPALQSTIARQGAPEQAQPALELEAA